MTAIDFQCQSLSIVFVYAVNTALNPSLLVYIEFTGWLEIVVFDFPSSSKTS
jgi:hypothetical protein